MDSAATVATEVAATLGREGLTASVGDGGSTTFLFTGDPNLARNAIVALVGSDPAAATSVEKLIIQSASPSTS